MEGYPEAFIAARRLLGAAMEEVALGGNQRPVLVGGAALELWPAGECISRDLALVVVDPAPIEAALIARGFRREDRRGHLLRGLYHPTPGIGVACVSGALFDGHADRRLLRMIRVDEGSIVLVIPAEHVIADRLGQYCSNRKASTDLLHQAALAYRLATGLDATYLDRWIREETAQELSLSEFERLVADGNA
jgi:hypothetical protein